MFYRYKITDEAPADIRHCADAEMLAFAAVKRYVSIFCICSLPPESGYFSRVTLYSLKALRRYCYVYTIYDVMLLPKNMPPRALAGATCLRVFEMAAADAIRRCHAAASMRAFMPRCRCHITALPCPRVDAY